MQIALEVNESTSDQLPSTTTESTSGVQQTRSSEGLTAPAQPNTTSAADQQQLMEFLYSESSGSVYTGPVKDTNTAGKTLVRLGVGLAIIIVVIALAILCQQKLNTLTTSKKKRKK